MEFCKNETKQVMQTRMLLKDGSANLKADFQKSLLAIQGVMLARYDVVLHVRHIILDI